MAEGMYITSNAARLLRRFDRLPKELRTEVKNGLARGLLLVEDRVRQGTDIKARRGSAGLMGRLTSHVKTGQDISVDGVIGFRRTRGFPYELSQEFGAHAKPGKAMAIPISGRAKALSNRGVGPREFPDGLVMLKLRGRKPLLVQHMGTGKRVRLQAHYVLVKSIPPRLRFVETVTASGGVISGEVERAAKTIPGIS